jgi:hypothetical protein
MLRQNDVFPEPLVRKVDIPGTSEKAIGIGDLGTDGTFRGFFDTSDMVGP